jgi:hypothetical protein
MFPGNRPESAPGPSSCLAWEGAAAAAPPPQGSSGRSSPSRPQVAPPSRIPRESNLLSLGSGQGSMVERDRIIGHLSPAPDHEAEYDE